MGVFLIKQQIIALQKAFGRGVRTQKGVIHSILRYPRTASGLLLGAKIFLDVFVPFLFSFVGSRQASELGIEYLRRTRRRQLDKGIWTRACGSAG